MLLLPENPQTKKETEEIIIEDDDHIIIFNDNTTQCELHNAKLIYLDKSTLIIQDDE